MVNIIKENYIEESILELLQNYLEIYLNMIQLLMNFFPMIKSKISNPKEKN